MTTAARNLAGATLAGTPLVLLGRSDTVAWGFTNTATDVQDIFVERVNPDNPDEYLTPDGWQPFGSKQETIKLRGGGERTFTRRWTRHGPVLPEGYRDIGSYLPDGTVAALQWTALAHDDTTLMSGLNIWNGKTLTDFQDAMRDYVTPMQSMVAADLDGNIGLIAPGRVPIRDPQNEVMGRAPVPGWDPLYDWKGWVPFDGLPRWNNPPIGAIATANAKIVGPEYPYLLTFDWEEPWRQERLDELIIDNAEKQSPEMSRNIQGDVHSTGLAVFGPEMIRLVEGKKDVDTGVVALLKGWDFSMRRESAAPLIFMAWLRESMIGIYRDDLGQAFEPWFRARAMVMQRLLLGTTARNWCDDRSTTGEETCADILAASLGRGARRPGAALRRRPRQMELGRRPYHLGQPCAVHQCAGSEVLFRRPRSRRRRPVHAGSRRHVAEGCQGAFHQHQRSELSRHLRPDRSGEVDLYRHDRAIGQPVFAALPGLRRSVVDVESIFIPTDPNSTNRRQSAAGNCCRSKDRLATASNGASASPPASSTDCAAFRR